MSILSVAFVAFVLVLLVLYYLTPAFCSPYILFAGSVFFYLQFDKRYALFLCASILCTFIGARWIGKTHKKKLRSFLLAMVLLLNIGTLFCVKFIPFCSWIVPVGISFYTLQVCGYVIDVYRRKYAPEKNIFKYATFASFFPLILQGPISRYDQLSTTLFAGRNRHDFYENITSGAQLALWGFFKKLVIADRAGMMANAVFGNLEHYSGVAVIMAVLCYTVQIYTDFSGCVDICRGVAKCFGVDVIDNFKQPYFSTSIQDFWRRWHIALSSWLKDYVYIPLGGNRLGTTRKYINLLIVFFVSGLWHGVGFHFILWGLLQGVFQIIGALTLPAKKRLCTVLHIDRSASWFVWGQRLITFILINISWIFFRVSTGEIGTVFTNLFRFETTAELLPALDIPDLFVLGISVLLLIVVGYYREKGYSIRKQVAKCPLPVAWTLYLVLFLVVLIFGIYGPGYSDQAFIYMNF